MAECRRFVCGSCSFTIDAWSDGNPYFIDEVGKKKYAYHPDHERLSRCIDNDEPHLCLRCAKEFNVDSFQPISLCPFCASPEIADCRELSGRVCPKCGRGKFEVDPDYFAIS